MSTEPTPRRKKTRATLNVALVQLTSHPSLRIGGTSLICEPFLDSETPPPLQALWDRGMAVDAIQDYCRERYLVWHRARLEAVVTWLAGLGDEEAPDVIVFPEGSIPRQYISCLQGKLKASGGTGRTHPLIFAGTHSYEHSLSARNDYLRLGVKEAVLQKLSKQDIDTLSVMPILLSDGQIQLRSKQYLSPWEYTAIGISHQADNSWRIDPLPHVYKGDSICDVEALVCSEALQRIQNHGESPDLVVILSYDRSPSQFQPIQEHYAKNQVPVAYCNDGLFGGTQMHMVMDNRNENWMSQPSRGGCLPSGDGILLVQIALQSNAPSVAVNNPVPSQRILRLASIVPNDDSDSSFRVSHRLRELRNSVYQSIEQGTSLDCGVIANACLQLNETEHPSRIQSLQISRLLSLARHHAAPIQEWRVFANDCVVTQSQYRDSIDSSRSSPVNDGCFHDEVSQGVPIRPCSLNVLERQLTEYCLLQIALLFDNVSNDATGVLVSVRARLLRRLGIAETHSPTATLSRVLEDLRREAYESAHVHLSNELARLTERFGATSGMLFIAHASTSNKTASPSRLVAQIMVNTPVATIERRIASADGIVGHVAYTRRPYIAERVSNDALELDVWLDPYYKSSVHSTRSELAVPIVSLGDDGKTTVLIGVLNLESRVVGAFSPIQVQELQSEAALLTVDIRVMQAYHDSKSTVVWHPRVHGWGTSGILGRVCQSVATTHSGGRRPPSVSCTIWHADQDKRKLFVRGTSRYDFEYIAQEMLNWSDSFLGWVLDNVEVGQVRSGRVDDLPRFRRRRKAERMELDSVSVSPFHVASGRSSGPLAKSGILAVYSFAHESAGMESSLNSVFSRDNVQRLAFCVGTMLSEMQIQRTRCALAHLNAVLIGRSAPGVDRFNQMLSALREVFDAGEGTLFSVRSGVAEVLSTTGVDKPMARYTSSRTHDAGTRRGFTRMLMSIDGSLRKHDIPDPSELCVVNGERITIVPANRIRESGAVSDSEHRRFLGASIGGKAGIVGIIRLIRSERDQPFVRADEDLLRLQTQQMAGWLSAPNEATAMTDDIHALDSCGLADSRYDEVGTWSGRSLNAWLQRYRHHCAAVFVKSNPVLASVRYGVRDSNDEWRLRVLAYHSTSARSFPKDEDGSPRRRANIGWTTIDSSLSKDLNNCIPRIVSFDRAKTKLYDCGIEHRVEVAAGLCVPVTWIGQDRIVPGVASIDFASRIRPTPKGIRQVFVQTLKLQSMARSREAFSFACNGDDTKEAASNNAPVAAWIDRKSDRFEGMHVLFRMSDETTFSIRDKYHEVGFGEACNAKELAYIQSLELKYSRWEPRMAWLAQAEMIGIRFDRKLRVLYVPLRIGPFVMFAVVGRLDRKWLNQTADVARKRALEHLNLDSDRRSEDATKRRDVLERSFGMTLEEYFVVREICALGNEIAEEWMEYSGVSGCIWNDWDIRFEAVPRIVDCPFDMSGLKIWAPKLASRHHATRRS